MNETQETKKLKTYEEAFSELGAFIRQSRLEEVQKEQASKQDEEEA